MTRRLSVANPDVAPITRGGCVVLAEAGQCMEGDVDRAVSMVGQVADTGAWGFKVQMLDPDRIVSTSAPNYWNDPRGVTQHESFTRSGCIPHDGWGPVRQACWDAGVAFVATPFDHVAVTHLATLRPDAIKVASGDLTNPPLLRACAGMAAHLGVPLIVSTGAATEHELDAAVHDVAKAGNPPTVWLACSLVYPTPPEDANLARIDTVGRVVSAWGDAGLDPDPWVGYSDHTILTYSAGVAGAVMGAVLLEKHYTDGHAVNTPDNDMAVDQQGLVEYVHGATIGAALRGSPELEPTDAEQPARRGASRSVHVVAPVRKGEVITADHLAVLRPGTGLTPDWLDVLVGRTAAEDVPVGILSSPPPTT